MLKHFKIFFCLFLLALSTIGLSKEKKVKVEWAAEKSAILYQLQISESKKFKKIILNKRVKKNYYNWKGFQKKKYFYRVRSKSKISKKWGPYSDLGEINFALKPIKSLIEKKIVKKGKKQKVLFRWSKTQFAKSYMIILTYGKKEIKRKTKETKKHFTLKNNKNYTWKVLAFDKNKKMIGQSESFSLELTESSHAYKHRLRAELGGQTVHVESDHSGTGVTQATGDVPLTSIDLSYEHFYNSKQRFGGGFSYFSGATTIKDTTTGETKNSISAFRLMGFYKHHAYTWKSFNMFYYGDFERIPSFSVSTTASFEQETAMLLSPGFFIEKNYFANKLYFYGLLKFTMNVQAAGGGELNPEIGASYRWRPKYNFGLRAFSKGYSFKDENDDKVTNKKMSVGIFLDYNF